MKVEEQAAALVLVEPVWLSQPCYPKLLNIVVSAPLRIHPGREIMIEVVELPLPELAPPLAMWHITGNTTQT